MSITSINGVNARSFSSLGSCKVSESSSANQGTPHDFAVPSVPYSQFFNTQRFYYTLSTGANITTGYISLFNNGDYWSCSNHWYASYSNYHANTMYNYIKVWRASTTIDSSWEFYIWNDLIKSYRHISTSSLGYVQDGVDFEHWFPYHGMVFFYDEDDGHTIQLIGNKTIQDKVLYVDPIENDQNVWVLDFYNKKAWSFHRDKPYDFTTYMFGLWSYNNDDFFADLVSLFTTSYTITEGGTFALPPTASQGQYSYYSSADGTHYFTTETSRYGKTFSYLADLDFQAPDWNRADLNTGGVISSGEFHTYNSCVDEITTIKRVASLEYACYNTIDYDCECQWGNCSCLSTGDYNGLYNYLRNYNGTGYYTGNIGGTSCAKWYNYTIDLYDGLWSGSYASKFLTANSWSVDPNSIVVENYCGSYPNSSSEMYWYCKYLGIGCSDETSLGFAYDNVKNWLRPYLIEQFTNLETSFKSGYNYFGVATKCNSDVYGKSYPWGNYLLIFVFGWILFTLYDVFK